MNFQVFSAVTGDLILQTPSALVNGDVVQYLKDEIFVATGVPKFCQQLIPNENNNIIRDETSWDLCGQPMDLKVAFQVASKHLGQELLDSAGIGNQDKVKVILEQFQDPNVADGAGETPLVKASHAGHVEVVQLLLDAGADLVAAPNHPLLVASSAGHHAVVHCLLGARGDSELRDTGQNTALCHAAQGGHVEVARVLLVRANVDAANISGQTPLLMAAARGFFTLMCLLLRHGADKDVTDADGWNALMFSSARGDLRGVSYLLEACVQVNTMNHKGRTALYLAAEGGHLDALRCLLAAGADPKVADKHGCTALFLAVEHGHSSAVASLLQARATHDIILHGRSPLSTASQCGHFEVVKLLLQAKASVDCASLSMAVKNEHEEIVRLLLPSDGAPSSIASPTLGWHNTLTPNLLLLAVGLGNTRILRMLLESGWACNGGSCKALCLAAGQRHVAAAEMLLRFRADVNPRSPRSAVQQSPLLMAAECPSLEMVKLLLDAMADYQARDAYGCNVM